MEKEIMDPLPPFARKKYINLETFRRSGEGVKTPVWFVQDGEVLYAQTMTDSGKVKRIRNNGRVNVATCRMDGTLIGNWISADAREITDVEISHRVNQLLNKKYGLLKRIFDIQNRNQRVINTIIEIRILK